MSLINELKRRNVFKVAIAYVVASWLALQITDVLMSVLSLPETAGKFVFLLVVIGFIPTLVFSWAFEVTPDGIKRESEVDRSESMTMETASRLNRITIGLLVAVAAMVLIDRFAPQQEATMSSDSEELALAPAEPVAEMLASAPVSDGRTPSVAVLPFVNMSSDVENEYFSDGISEELINLLVRIDGLRVPSRTSSFAFKGRNMNIREIAKQLEVGHVLEGSVRKSGNQVRITAQLIDVTTDTHLWSDTYDRELKDIFVIQDEIAGHIVEAMQLVLAPGTTARKPTTNMEAYNLYLQGLHLFWGRGDGLIDGESFLRQAVELDPDFAEAWATLALTYVVQPNYIYVELGKIEPLALAAANKASELNPGLVEPLLARGNLAGKHSRVLEAMELYEEAAKKNPRNVTARLWYGIELMSGGYIVAAREQLEAARDLDPAAGIIFDWLARAQIMSGQLEPALLNAEKGLSLGRAAAAMTLLHHYFDTANVPALREVESRLPDIPYWHSWEKILQAKENPDLKDELYSWAEDLYESENNPVQWTKINAYLNLGDISLALPMMGAGIQYDATFLTAFWWPDQVEMRKHPEFRDFARDFGLMELWQTRGWPDMCRPLGEDDFECD